MMNPMGSGDVVKAAAVDIYPCTDVVSRRENVGGCKEDRADA